VQVLDHQHQWGLLAQAPQQPQQQLKQPRLGGLVGLAGAVRLSQGGRQAGQLRPGGADQLADRAHAEVGEQDPQRLHDRGVGRAPSPTGTQPPASTRVPSLAQRLVSSAIRRVLPTPASPPHKDDGRVAACGPLSGRLEGLELLDAADEGRARHAAAHLAEIIPRDRPEGKRRPYGAGAQRWGTRRAPA
jgi:hypothetical protein